MFTSSTTIVRPVEATNCIPMVPGVVYTADDLRRAVVTLEISGTKRNSSRVPGGICVCASAFCVSGVIYNDSTEIEKVLSHAEAIEKLSIVTTYKPELADELARALGPVGIEFDKAAMLRSLDATGRTSGGSFIYTVRFRMY